MAKERASPKMERAKEKTRVAVSMTKVLERTSAKDPGITHGDPAKENGTRTMQVIQTKVESPLLNQRDMVVKTR